MAILVTGSTGTIGTQVLNFLDGHGAEVRALTRSPEKANFAAGVTAVKGDLADIDSIRAALDGVSTLFLLAPNAPDELTQAMLALNAAREAGVKGIVYLSVFKGEAYADVPHFASKITKRDPRVPAWTRASFKDWEAERMAVYAAQVDILDQGIGRIVAELEKQGELDNTLIFFMADNGGNFEEMGPSKPGARRPIYMNYKTRDGRPIETGNSPTIMPGPETTYASYGGPWGNVSNTPFRLYKHFAHEGGISTPFIAHWPAGIAAKGAVTQQIGHEIDVMATCLAASGVSYPHDSVAGSVPPPLEGRSLLPAFAGKAVPNRGMIFWEHEGNCAVRDGKWKLVSRFPDTWELYDMEADRTESDDLVDREPEQVKRLAAAYEGWAKRVGAQPWPMPQTPAGARTGELPMPDYLRVDRPVGSVVSD